MPYNRKRQSRSTRYMRKSGDAIQVASKALSTAYAVKKLLNVEYKVHDQTITAAPSLTGVVSFLGSGLVQGDASNTREGNSILIKSIQLRGQVTTTVPNHCIRYIVFMDTDGTGTAPAVGDLLANNDTEGMYSVLRYPGRFRVLLDKVYDVSSNGKSRQSFHLHQTMNVHQKWNGSGGAVTDARKNALYLLSISSGSATLPSNNLHWRYRFIDN